MKYVIAIQALANNDGIYASKYVASCPSRKCCIIVFKMFKLFI